MRRRDVGRHRQGKAFGFARSRRPIREHGPDRVIDHFDALFAAVQELLAVEVC